MKNHLRLLVLLLFVLCSKEEVTLTDPNPTIPAVEVPKSEVTESYNIIDSIQPYKSYSGSLLETFAKLSTEMTLDYDFENVAITKIFFKTTNENGAPIIGSGVVILPAIETPLGLVSFQHSTIESNSEAPINSALGRNELTVASVIASTGYITILSDYIGYGINFFQRHPYEHKASLANNTYDMLLAAESFLLDQEIDFPESLYLMGYSEGGGATLALHEKIEKENKFNITQTFAGAGAYDKTEFLNKLISTNEDLSFLGYYLWVLDVYNNFYPSLRKDWTYYVNEPYATNLKALGVINESVSEDLISLNPTTLFTDDFRNGVSKGSNSELLEVIAENDLINWNPVAPISLFHGTLDDFVFPLNSLNAYTKFMEGGSEVEYIQIEDKDHNDAAIPFFFESLVKIHNRNP